MPLICNPFVLKLVLPGMKVHTQQFGLQMAATACLYNLTRGDLAHKIHPNVLRKVVELTLIAMETYPNHYQVYTVLYKIIKSITIINM